MIIYSYSTMKLYILILLSILASTTVFGATITSYGSQDYFINDQTSEFFSTGYDGDVNNNQSLPVVSNLPAVACNIDTSTTANELIIASGSTVYMYSAVGNLAVALDTYTATGTITELACYKDRIYIAEPTLRILEYDSELVSVGVSSVGDVVDFHVSQEAGRITVLHNDSIFLYNETGSLFSEGIGYDTNGEIVFDDYYDVHYINDSSVFVLDPSGNDVYTLSTTTVSENFTNTLNMLDPFTDTGAPSDNVYVFADFNGDDVPEFCYIRNVRSAGGSDSVTSYCYDSTLTSIATQPILLPSPRTMTTRGVAVWDKDLDGNDELYIQTDRTGSGITDAIYQLLPYSNTTLFTGFTSEITTDNTIAFTNATGGFMYIDNGQLRDDTFTFVEDGFADTITVADITGDNILEIISVDTSETYIYFWGDTSPTSSVTFASNVVQGGFFGYPSTDVCVGSNVTFKATECIGDITVCNYFNSINENERLATDCGTGTDTIGAYSIASPQVTCEYTSAGTYDVVIAIQSASTENNLTSNSNVPIQLTVSNDAGCNGATYTVPRQTNDTTTNTGENTAPDVTEDTQDQSGTASTGNALADTFINNIFLIIGIIITLAFPVTLIGNKIRHPFILMLSSVLGAGFSTILGLFSLTTFIFVTILIVAVAVVTGLLFKQTSNFSGE